MPADYYDVLGVPRAASDDEIKRAYRQLARRHHPDVAKDKSAGDARFKEINEAYEVLSDPQKRRMYDRYGHAATSGAASRGAGSGPFSGFGGEGFGDIFDMFFGASQQAQRRPAGPQRGADLRYDIEISLEEAFHGAEHPIVFTHLAACERCAGSGAEPGTLITSCDRCGGSGVMRTSRQTALGSFVTQTTCTKCNGEGVHSQTPCELCRGRGRVERRRTLTVKIPPGVDDGSRIRLSGNGEAGLRGGPPGDLYVYLTVLPHPRFRRDGPDLYVDVPISFPQAALGGTVDVEALDGPVQLTIPAGTQSGVTYRVPGHGMPSVRGAARGTLQVTVHVVVPTKLSRRERELLEQFAEEGGDRIEDRSFFERVKDAFKVE
ncbi:MAG: molecular chaperone DnaJ [Candidatus Eremiobacteraeota bacterium]|nr:molecular chaperone DnaJ [Candidatus Eremiobacteraeota bacterium]